MAGAQFRKFSVWGDVRSDNVNRIQNVTKAYPIGEVTIQALAGVDFSILEGNSSLF